MMEALRAWVPITAEAFDDYRMGSTHLSKAGLDVVRRLLAGENVTVKDSGLAPREWRELMADLGREA
jgi:thymidylate synthase (FAD)